jgi:uncharacterized protein
MGMILRLDPKFLSLGEFQHEVNQGKLRTALQRAMELGVNFVGVDPGFAPPHVLAHVAGLNQDLVRALVQAREAGPFAGREALKAPLGDKFRFAAGFLRVEASAEKLDQTFVHPDFYEAVKAYASAQGNSDPFALSDEQKGAIAQDEKVVAIAGAANAANIAYELGHPGEDPRGAFKLFDYDPSLKTLADLKPATPYPGVVTNVTSFGAFVDIGIDQDGLVHISELTDALAKNPFDSLYPGDSVIVFVSGVNEEKKQISLTMRAPGARPERKGRAAGAAGREKRKGPRRPPRGAPQVAGAEGGASAEGAQAPGAEAQGQGAEGGRERRPGNRFRGKERGPRRDKEGGERERKPRKPQKPQRDPKTGAIVKFEEEEGRSPRGMKLPSKAKPHTFNPFANLANILKEKQEK